MELFVESLISESSITKNQSTHIHVKRIILYFFPAISAFSKFHYHVFQFNAKMKKLCDNFTPQDLYKYNVSQ